MRHRTWEEMRARGWNRAFQAAHGSSLNELLFLLVVMLVLTVAGVECAKMSSHEQLDFAVAGQLKERILDTIKGRACHLFPGHGANGREQGGHCGVRRCR